MTMHEPAIISADLFHRERSLFLDAFAALESVVVLLLRQSGEKVTGDPLGNKVETLKRVKPSSQYSKARKTLVDDLLIQIEPLLAVRADIVHASLKIAKIDKTIVACFTNTRELGELAPLARIVTLESLGQLTKQVGKLASELANYKHQSAIINPASSPPPPWPGAAGGP